MLDEMNLKIIKLLNGGSKSPKEIAKTLDVSYNTVRRRIERMKSDGLLKMRGLVNTNEIPNHFMALVCLNFNNRDLPQRCEEISQLTGVVSVGIVTGRFDLVVWVLLNQENDLYNFNIKELSKIQGIVYSETFVMYKNVGWDVPFVL